MESRFAFSKAAGGYCYLGFRQSYPSLDLLKVRPRGFAHFETSASVGQFARQEFQIVARNL